MKYLSIEEKKEILKEYQGGKAIGTIAINLHFENIFIEQKSDALLHRFFVIQDMEEN